MEHWSHALSTVLLLVTGVGLGFLFIPRLVSGTETVGFLLNLHFVGVLLFMFGIFYYASNALVNGKFQEHLPEVSDFQGALAHYAAKFSGKHPAPDGKYIASEKLAYLGFAVAVFGIVATGSVKVAAHVFSLPGWLMQAMTFLHDLAALGMLAMLAMHVLMSSIVPWSWPLVGGILHGYVSEEYVREHHALWYEELRRGGAKKPAGKPAPDQGKGVPVTQ
jgi:formate dehydrogenase subunit gamma